MVLKSNYDGFVAPVYTPFDANGELNLSEIPKYAQYLHNQKVNGVLVGGTTGEGLSMTTDERKKLTEAWMSATKNTGQHVQVHVGGTNLKSVIELAKHAESVGVWSIMCLPDMLFRPSTIDEVISYLKVVSAAAPHTPLFFYHYPWMTGITLDMTKFMDKAYSEIPTISGAKFSDNNLDEVARCVQLHNRAFTIYLSCDQLILPALSLGINSHILTSLTYAAPDVYALKENFESGNIAEAQRIQYRIRSLTEYIQTEMSWVYGFKTIISWVANLNLGDPRPPQQAISCSQRSKLQAYLKQHKWL